jgi:hypothetical protein
MIIPQQLKNARFILVRPRQKNAFQTGWNQYANYAYDDPDLLSHLSRGGNYGVLSWNGICTMDIDDFDIFQKTGIILPDSFLIKRGNAHRGHYYFTCSDCPDEKREKYILTFGDVRLGGNYYVVGPNCIHPSGELYNVFRDYPIVDIPYEFILKIIDKYELGTDEPPAQGIPKNKYPPMANWGDTFHLKCMDILPPSGKTITTGIEVKGDHPIHGSSNGFNYHINTATNEWFCHRHKTGGNAVMLYAMKKGILQCEDCKPGCLRGKGERILIALREDGYDIGKIGLFGKLTENTAVTKDLLKSLGVL